jgi:hypothetical protein
MYIGEKRSGYICQIRVIIQDLYLKACVRDCSGKVTNRRDNLNKKGRNTLLLVLSSSRDSAKTEENYASEYFG